MKYSHNTETICLQPQRCISTINNGLHQRLHVEPQTHTILNHEHMTQWIAGFSDGDGTFSITKSTNGKSYQFTFKITQSLYNYRALYKIKKWIGYGSISKDGNTLCQYRIRDTKILKKVIVPIFESYPLHTVKYKSYMLWKEALFFPERRESVCKELSEWNKTLKNSEKRIDFKSPHDKIPFKSWIIGFTEAEGSFFLTQKEENRIVHSFGITQKHDIHLLEILKKVFWYSCHH